MNGIIRAACEAAAFVGGLGMIVLGVDGLLRWAVRRYDCRRGHRTKAMADVGVGHYTGAAEPYEGR